MSLLTENNLISKVIFAEQVLVDGNGDIEAKVSDAVNIQGANQVQLLIDFTVGGSSGVELKIEFSEDQEHWYQESFIDSVSLGVVEHFAVVRKIYSTSSIIVSIPVSGSYVRITATALTVGTGALISITATASNI